MSDWIEHDGSAWPKQAERGDALEVRFRDGIEILVDTDGMPEGTNLFKWYDTNLDIVAYRIVDPT